MACASAVPEILRVRTYKNIKWLLMRKLTTSKCKQKSLYCLWAVSPVGLTGSPKPELMASQRTIKGNCICIPKPISKGAYLRNAWKDYSEQRAMVRRCFVTNTSWKGGSKSGVLDKRLSNWRDIQLLSILISSVSRLIFSGLYLQCCYINLYFVSVLNLDGVGARKSLWNHSS